MAQQLRVGLSFTDSVIPVGVLARRERTIYFEYDAAFVSRGLEISPLRCPVRLGVQEFDPTLFDGLAGVFHDSLPDGWGRLLLERALRLRGDMPERLSALDRLAYVGHTGMGALVYDPHHDEHTAQVSGACDIDLLVAGVRDVLRGEATDVLQELLSLNGSSAGARPKVMLGVSQDRKDLVYGSVLPSGYQSWLVKFPNMQDGEDAGAIEYVYALMARDAGLQMSDAHLFPTKHGAGCFATQRFDRRDGMHNGGRLHMHSASGLLHGDPRTPSLDYEALVALTVHLTQDVRQAENLYRLAVFNALAHNRDDHGKNISYLMDEQGRWTLAPAYDLTFSAGPQGEHSTTIMGQGTPSRDALIRLGSSVPLTKHAIHTIIEQCQDALASWTRYAKTHGVQRDSIDSVEKQMQRVRKM